MRRDADICIVGAGSGGIGAALAAGRMGLRVLLMERAPTVGGTAVRAGVSTWEPVAGATGIPFEIYLRLREVPDAVALYSYGRHMCWQHPDETPFPGGEHVIDPSISYLDTLQRHGMTSLSECQDFARASLHGVVFEPDAYAEVVGEMLRQAGVEVLTGVGFLDADVSDSRVERVRLSDGSDVRARAFIDCTGHGALCAACGCETASGRESRERFGEPHAPEEASPATNAATLIYRILPADEERVEPLPHDVPEECWWQEQFPSVSAVQAPRGGYIMNMLPTMQWPEVADPGSALHAECVRRVLAHWHHVQRNCPEFRRHRLAWIAPEVGMREERRVVGECILTEHDLLTGLSGQEHADIIAIADHAMDLHGKAGGCRELDEPYGIPLRCLLPRGMRNLLVASRAASLSSIAASSCRLSRTMMHLGQAAGTAAAMAVGRRCDPVHVPADELRAALRAQHVQLDWPMPESLRAWMERAERAGPPAKRTPGGLGR
ncbi:MAG: FAD-dependent oxidoreductase [Armatimonadota bacterium]|nr:FAD-dependent oxidoreductase [Armatimonadota bacterium]